MLKFIKRMFLAGLLVVVILTAAGLIYLEVNRDNIRAMMIGKLNEQLLTEMEIGSMKLGIFTNFPHFTASFHDVYVHDHPAFREGKEKTAFEGDTLLFAGTLNIDLALLPLIKKKVNFNRLSVYDGKLAFKKDQNKKVNYNIIKEGDGKSQGSFHLELKNASLNNVRVAYIDDHIQSYISGHTKRSRLQKKWQGYELETKLVIDRLQEKKYMVMENYPIEGRISFEADSGDILIDKAKLKLPEANARLTGKYYAGGPHFLGLKFELEEIKPEKLLAFALKKNADLIKLNVKPSAIKAGGTISIARKNYKTQMDIGLKLDNAVVGLNDLVFRKVSLNARYTNDKIDINDISARFRNNNLKGRLELSKLKKPIFVSSLTGDIDLADLGDLIPGLVNYHFSGKAHVNLSLSGRLKELKNIDIKTIDHLEPVGHVELLDATASLSHESIFFSRLKGSIMLGKHFWMDGISGRINGNPFTLSGEARDAVGYLTGKTKILDISGEVKSSNFIIDNLLAVRKENGDRKKEPETDISRQEEEKRIWLPDWLKIRLDARADSLSLGRFSSSDFKASLVYNPGKLELNSISLNAMEGKLKGDLGLASQESGKLHIQARSKLDNINIKELFWSMNNFGQDFITDKNLDGSFNGNIYFDSHWSDKLKIDRKSIIAESDFVIKDGQLIDFEPVMSLSKFIAVKELEDIKFSDLTNTVYINEEKVIIPQMDIKSSAMNLTAAGVHGFDGIFNYKLRLLLSEVLFSKARRSKKENEEFGIVEDDGLGMTSIYLNINGSKDKTNVSYDKKEMMKKVKEDIKKEKDVFLDLFRKKPPPEEQQTEEPDAENNKEFNIVWDEEETDSTEVK